MLTYLNYEGVEKGAEQYEKIAERNILVGLRDPAGPPKEASPEEGDLVQGAEAHPEEIGLSPEQIDLLKAKLTGDAA